VRNGHSHEALSMAFRGQKSITTIQNKYIQSENDRYGDRTL
jgi:hypothetical protein